MKLAKYECIKCKRIWQSHAGPQYGFWIDINTPDTTKGACAGCDSYYCTWLNYEAFKLQSS